MNTRTTEIIVGLAAVIALGLSAGAALALEGPNSAAHQVMDSSATTGTGYGGMMDGGYSGGGSNGLPSGMMRTGYGGGMMGGISGGYSGGYPSGMMGYGGMMGQGYGGMMSGGMMDGYRNGNTTYGGTNGPFVAIAGYSFQPPSLTVKAGTTVTWVNMDFVQHTVTSGTDSAPSGIFDSHELSHMQGFSFTFTTPGTYTYYCDVHPSMVGTIAVTA